MNAEKRFLADLNEMFNCRIGNLKSIMEITVPKQSKQKFTRDFLRQKVYRLCELATDEFVGDYFKKEVKRETISDEEYTIAGRGIREKKTLFKQWVKDRFPESPLLVYVFTSKSGRCLYVGKTGRGGKRPLSQFDKHWIHQAKYVWIYEVKNKSHLPKLECLATHFFCPGELQKQPSAHKWTKACPICEKHKLIQKEISLVFRLKSRTRSYR
jgi:hypothetical protein